METKTYRPKLTDAEFTAVARLTHNIKVDDEFDIYRKNKSQHCFVDFVNTKFIPLKAGFKTLYEAMAYPLKHNKIDEEEAKLICSLFNEYDATDEDTSWLLDDDE